MKNYEFKLWNKLKVNLRVKEKAWKEILNKSSPKLELIEGLEQNRWIENGYPVHIAVTEFDSISVDTQEELENIRKIMSEQEIKL